VRLCAEAPARLFGLWPAKGNLRAGADADVVVWDPARQQSLEEYVKETELVRDHTRIGENIRPWLLLMFLALVGLMLVDRAIRRRGEPVARTDALQIARVALSVVSIVFAGISVYWVYRIGHSGSKAVWHNTQVRIDRHQSHPESGDEDG
jgi:hypothetical protein